MKIFNRTSCLHVFVSILNEISKNYNNCRFSFEKIQSSFDNVFKKTPEFKNHELFKAFAIDDNIGGYFYSDKINDCLNFAELSNIIYPIGGNKNKFVITHNSRVFDKTISELDKNTIECFAKSITKELVKLDRCL